MRKGTPKIVPWETLKNNGPEKKEVNS